MATSGRGASVKLEPSGLEVGDDMVAGCGLLVAGELVAGEVWVAGNAVVAGCGLLVAGGFVVAAWEVGGAGTERRPGVSWEKSRAVVQRKTAGKHTRRGMKRN